MKLTTACISVGGLDRLAAEANNLFHIICMENSIIWGPNMAPVN
jgi:uncharacterized FlgJ-related protein